MWYKIAISTSIVFLMVSMQIALVSTWGAYWGSFNLTLSLLVFLLFMMDFNWVMFLAVLSGFIFDIYSSLPFGVFMVSMLGVSIVLKIILTNLFTNRSFYSVISLGIVGVVLFNLIFLAVGGIVYLLGWSNFYIDSSYLVRLLYQVINAMIVLSVLFFLANSFSRKFKPNFIRS